MNPRERFFAEQRKLNRFVSTGGRVINERYRDSVFPPLSAREIEFMDSRQEDHDWAVYDEDPPPPEVIELRAWIDWFLIFLFAGACFWLGTVVMLTIR